LLAAVGVKKNEPDKLQKVPAQQLLDALDQLPGRPAGGIAGTPRGAIMRFSPVVDGKFLPAHPFDPVAASSGADVPVIVGTNRDESATFVAADPRRRRLTDEELRQRLTPLLGANLEKVIGAYKKSRPTATPWDLFIGIQSEGSRRASIQLAERKAAQNKAPVYMYLVTYESNFLGGLFKAGHGIEIPYVFDIVDDVPMAGNRPDRQEMAKAMSGAWIAFAHNGVPDHPGIPKWVPFTGNNRATMVFDVPSRLEVEPFADELKAWEGMELRR